MLRHFGRISLLTLVVELFYVWFVSMGTRTVCDSLRCMVDLTDRLDLSIFHIVCASQKGV